jgi:hypothetical protein
MDILLIEAAAKRRVAVAKGLWQQGHRITLASSVAEAVQITAFMRRGEPGPDVVLIGERLLKNAERLRQQLGRGAKPATWVPLLEDFQAAEILPRVRRARFRVIDGGLSAAGHASGPTARLDQQPRLGDRRLRRGRGASADVDDAHPPRRRDLPRFAGALCPTDDISHSA